MSVCLLHLKVYSPKGMLLMVEWWQEMNSAWQVFSDVILLFPKMAQFQGQTETMETWLLMTLGNRMKIKIKIPIRRYTRRLRIHTTIHQFLRSMLMSSTQSRLMILNLFHQIMQTWPQISLKLLRFYVRISHNFELNMNTIIFWPKWYLKVGTWNCM